jgi:nucleotide-binding universal stress UspA family protein
MTVEVPIRRVVVPFDGSALAGAALGPATTLARLFGAAVELVHVVTPPPAVGPEGQVYYQPAVEAVLLDAIIRQAHEMLDKTVARLAADGLQVTTRVLIDQRIAAAVLEESRPGDVIALATHARGPATRWFLGSVADKLIRAAEVPVLVVRPKG